MWIQIRFLAEEFVLNHPLISCLIVFEIGHLIRQLFAVLNKVYQRFLCCSWLLLWLVLLLFDTSLVIDWEGSRLGFHQSKDRLKIVSNYRDSSLAAVSLNVASEIQRWNPSVDNWTGDYCDVMLLSMRRVTTAISESTTDAEASSSCNESVVRRFHYSSSFDRTRRVCGPVFEGLCMHLVGSIDFSHSTPM